MCHWSKQVSEGATSGEYGGWGRTSYFNVSKYDHFRNMGSSIVMLQNHFIVSLVVLRSFVFRLKCINCMHTDRLWLFQSVLTAHNTLRRAGPTKYRAWSWSREYSVWNVDVEAWQGTPPWFSALGIIVMNPFFVPSHNAMQKSLPSLPFKQLFTSKQTLFNSVQHSRLQLVRHPTSLFWIIPMTLRRFEMVCWVTLNDRANSSWFWHES